MKPTYQNISLTLEENNELLHLKRELFIAECQRERFSEADYDRIAELEARAVQFGSPLGHAL